MANDNQIAFLCSRLKELREKNGCTMDDMAKKIDVLEGLKPGTGMNKSSISRVEGGKTAEKTLLEMARKYCKVFGMSESQTEQFLRGEKAAVPDTSALLKNSQLIDELNKEYSKVVIPKVVVDELDNIKNKNSGSLGRKAWEVIRGISYGSRTILMEYNGDADEDNEDCKIIYIAQEASDTYHCKVDIITEDTDYSAYLKGHESVSALHLREYMATKQDLINMTKLARIDAYYADSYEECEEPTADEVNAYLQDGNTLIISAVRNNRATIEQRKEKIKWLIQLGADVNKRDCSRRYFPALSHAVQMKDYEMFMFLLLECKANPNVGSQRVMIAMALACEPSLLIADEPTTALDVTIQAQILKLMNELKKEKGTSILFITHDLGVINQMADEVAVMYCGQVVEMCKARTIFAKETTCSHPYTEGLMTSIPRLDTPVGARLEAIPGAVPHPLNLPKGCKFAPRCKYATEKCMNEEPKLELAEDNHLIRCFYPDKEARHAK